MTDLDDKLREILEYYQKQDPECIAEIKQVFVDEGWVEPIEMRRNIVHPFKIVETMTGQDWYDRFEMYAGELQSYQFPGQAWMLAKEAAKKASGL